MRILITGSRDWEDDGVIEDAIAQVMHEQGISSSKEVTLVVGGARGADQIAQRFGEESGMTIELHKAHWDQYGKAAGPIRNQEMVDSGADICLGFLNPGSKGARNCVRLAQKSKIPTRLYGDGVLEI